MILFSMYMALERILVLFPLDPINIACCQYVTILNRMKNYISVYMEGEVIQHFKASINQLLFNIFDVLDLNLL